MGVTSFFYDEYGVNHQAKWELVDGVRSSTNYHFFDEEGNFIRKYREFSDSLTSMEIYKYDKNNNLIEESFVRSDIVSGRAYYEYDSNGNLSKTVCNNYKGWLKGIITYEYDDSYNKISGKIEQNGQKIGLIQYVYNEKGQLLKEYWELSNNWNQTFSYEYKFFTPPVQNTYTSSNAFITNIEKYLVSKENYVYSGEKGGPSHFEYDEKGKLIKKIFKRSDGLRTETTFKYDQEGNLYESLRKLPNGAITAFRYIFNEKRRLIYRFYHDGEKEIGSEKYYYNETGSLLQADYDNFDSWLSGTITFDLDDSGNLSKGHFKGKGKFDAEILFINDANGNIVKIHWEFSFGKTQTYTFEYEKMD